MDDILEQVAAWLAEGQPVALGTVVEVQRCAPRQPGAAMAVNGRGEVAGSVSGGCVEGALYEEATAVLAGGGPRLLTYGVAAFIQSFAPPPRMLVFGATDLAAAAVRMGKFLGYRVTLCDARGVFATRARFPGADEVIARWPHEYGRRRRTWSVSPARWGWTSAAVPPKRRRFPLPLRSSPCATADPAGGWPTRGGASTPNQPTKLPRAENRSLRLL